MEEILIPDIVINSTKYTSDGKTYSLYCTRPTEASAEAIKDDLIQNGFDATTHQAIVNKHKCFEIWWRKR